MTATSTRYGRTTPRSVRAADGLPSWMGSIRFRIALLYSTFLFGLAAILVAVIYLGVSRSLEGQSVYNQYVSRQTPFGTVVEEQTVVDIEKLADERAVQSLRNYAYGSLAVLFGASIVIGWLVAGRVLRPIERITAVARDIQATDLNRRIGLTGPDDELKHLADTFDDMLGRLDDAFESQRQFIHEASHELRNPLAVIRTNLEVTLADPDTSADDLRHTAEVVQKSTERMARLVDDLLVYARKGSLSLERTAVDVGEVVQGVTEEFQVSAAEAGLRLEHAEMAGLLVDGDRLALQQAVANLLANAVRVSPPGGTIRVTAGRHDPWVWMAVADEGPGIAPEDQERVFQRFWRGDDRAARDAGRSGLGLTIVRQIAEAHGGEVRLVSAPGEGATFAVWLPAKPPA